MLLVLSNICAQIKRDYQKFMYTIILVIVLNVQLSVSNESECDCKHYNECEAVFRSLKINGGETQIPSCDVPGYNGYYCCPKPIKKTISERKCREFSQIENFCPQQELVNGGIPVIPHEIPFIASIQVRNKLDKNAPWQWKCGGALIDPKFVLTAAHCFDYVNSTTTEITVLLGAHNITKTALRNGDGRFNVTIIIHDSSIPFGDIALLELETAADITTNKIRPACLPKTNGSEVEEFTAAGFGTVDGFNLPSGLLKTTLKTQPIENCKFRENSKVNISMQFCTAPNRRIGGDVCPGDSGGPVFIEYPGRNDCLYAVMGIVSEGNFCGANASHTVHTRVSYYREWIESIVWPNELKEE